MFKLWFLGNDLASMNNIWKSIVSTRLKIYDILHLKYNYYSINYVITIYHTTEIKWVKVLTWARSEPNLMKVLGANLGA